MRSAMNGVNKGQGMNETLQWKVGLVNSEGKYLTAETFGNKINASGTSMRKKQFWLIEHDDKEEDVVYIKSHLGRYLSGDKKGNVTCCAESKGDEEKFKIGYDGSGKWSFQNKTTTYYFGGTDDKLSCYEKSPRANEWWTINLAIHPHVNIRNVNRKKYAHLNTEDNQLQVTELIPWGEDALITLEFSNGKYAVKASNGKYLNKEGDLVDSTSEDTLYSLEIRSGQYSGMALKHSSGKYLSAVGSKAVMQVRNKAVSKDELFTLEDSHPQVFFTAHNGKKVSIKQGVDLTANQEELEDTETFQVEYDKKGMGWRFRTTQNKYWVFDTSSKGIQGTAADWVPNGLFQMEHLEDGSIAMKAPNGRYVSAKVNGSLYADLEKAENRAVFKMTIINRPTLILKCDYGFVGISKSAKVECNKVNQDGAFLEHTDGESAVYYIKASNGSYWSVSGDGTLSANSNEPQPFILNLVGQSKLIIKAPNGNYIKGEQNGLFTAKSSEISKATQWEY